MSEILLQGLPANNPLGFLAAMGVLVTADRALGSQGTALRWRSMPSGRWCPVLRVADEMAPVRLRDVLWEALHQTSSLPEREALGVKVGTAPDKFAAFARSAADSATPRDRRLADVAAAFACELATELVDKKVVVCASRMSKNNGAGWQYMLEEASSLASGTSKERLGAALFDPWDYADRKCNLSWDPALVHSHAHMLSDPSKSDGGASSMHGANLLAYAALVLLPTAIQGHGALYTTGTAIIEEGGSATSPKHVAVFSWPIWGRPLCLDVVRSVVAHAQIHCDPIDWGVMSALGIDEVYRARHFAYNKSSRFRPARPAGGAVTGWLRAVK